MRAFILVTYLSLASLATAQDQDAVRNMLVEGKSKIETGYRNWSTDEMTAAKAMFERALTIAPENVDAIYWIAYADYCLTIRHLYGAEKNEDLAEKLIEEGIKMLESAIKIDPNHSESLALIGNLTGMKIGFSPISGMWLGPKANGYYDDAIKANPNNPRAYYLKGIGKLKTPGMFGGGAEKAIPELEKAIALYKEQTPDAGSVQPDWGYDGCLTFLGNAYAEIKNFEKAKMYYEQALTVNPDSRQAKAALAKLESAK